MSTVVYWREMTLTIGDVMAVGIAAIISAALNFQGRDSIGADIVVLVMGALTVLALLLDMWLKKSDRSWVMVWMILALIVVAVCMLVSLLQAADYAYNDYTAATLVVFGIIAIGLILYKIYMDLKALPNSKAVLYDT